MENMISKKLNTVFLVFFGEVVFYGIVRLVFLEVVGAGNWEWKI